MSDLAQISPILGDLPQRLVGIGAGNVGNRQDTELAETLCDLPAFGAYPPPGIGDANDYHSALP